MKWFVMVSLSLISAFGQAKISTAQKRALDAAAEGKIEDLRRLPKSFNWTLSDSNGESLLIKAVSTGQSEAVAFLLKKKVKINHVDKAGNSALLYAVSNNDTPIAAQLMSAGADLTLKYGKKKEHILFEAARVGAREIADQILAKSPSLLNELNADGESPLMAAIAGAQTQLALHWIQKGASVSHKTRDGKSMADYARSQDVKDGSPLAQALLSQGETK